MIPARDKACNVMNRDSLEIDHCLKISNLMGFVLITFTALAHSLLELRFEFVINMHLFQNIFSECEFVVTLYIFNLTMYI